MRKPIIVGNWKMNKTREDAKAFMEEIEAYLTGEEKATYGVATPFTCLADCQDRAKNLVVSAQNVHFEDSGAFTGEISIPMLKDLGVSWTIIGHSERRGMFNETDEAINKKLTKLFENGFTPILCIGETEAQFDDGKTEEVIRTQLQKDLCGLKAEDVAKMVIAYEPIWAIGTGKSATKEIAENCCRIVRDEVRKLFGEATAEAVRVQYGGSVKPTNIKEYMEMEDIDGALIGGASLVAESFKAIIDATK